MDPAAIARDFHRTQAAYRQVMAVDDDARAIVWSDLKYYCKAEETTFDPDPGQRLINEGRRQVYMRLREWVEMEAERLWERRGMILRQYRDGARVVMSLKDAQAPPRDIDDEEDRDEFMEEVVKDE